MWVLDWVWVREGGRKGGRKGRLAKGLVSLAFKRLKVQEYTLAGPDTGEAEAGDAGLTLGISAQPEQYSRATYLATSFLLARLSGEAKRAHIWSLRSSWS